MTLNGKFQVRESERFTAGSNGGATRSGGVQLGTAIEFHRRGMAEGREHSGGRYILE